MGNVGKYSVHGPYQNGKIKIQENPENANESRGFSINVLGRLELVIGLVSGGKKTQ